MVKKKTIPLSGSSLGGNASSALNNEVIMKKMARLIQAYRKDAAQITHYNKVIQKSVTEYTC